MRTRTLRSLIVPLLVVVPFSLTPSALTAEAGPADGSHAVASSACADIHEMSGVAASVLRDFDAVVIGETHGTNEVPRHFLGFVCDALAVAKSIHVGLEYPKDAVDAARNARLAQDDPGAHDALARSDFWRLSRDGRSSASYARMLRQLLEMEDAGLISVIGFDTRVTGLEPFGDTASQSLLDASALQTTKSRIFILLTGHGHADFSSGKNSLSNSLADRGLNVLQLEYTHSGGTAWVCISGKCGETRMPARGSCSTAKTTDFSVKALEPNRAYASHCVGNITYSAPELDNWSQ